MLPRAGRLVARRTGRRYALRLRCARARERQKHRYKTCGSSRPESHCSSPSRRSLPPPGLSGPPDSFLRGGRRESYAASRAKSSIYVCQATKHSHASIKPDDSIGYPTFGQPHPHWLASALYHERVLVDHCHMNTPQPHTNATRLVAAALAPGRSAHERHATWSARACWRPAAARAPPARSASRRVHAVARALALRVLLGTPCRGRRTAAGKGVVGRAAPGSSSCPAGVSTSYVFSGPSRFTRVRASRLRPGFPRQSRHARPRRGRPPPYPAAVRRPRHTA